MPCKTKLLFKNPKMEPPLVKKLTNNLSIRTRRNKRISFARLQVLLAVRIVHRF